ncbi:MAG: hypothetical protein H7210_01685, partial [Pyrinomonadaceae bacterium]|nr:hypothetical protein [Phycisphaerales bacterium]
MLPNWAASQYLIRFGAGSTLEIAEVIASGLNSNGNGDDDTIDIMLGNSSDDNGDGIPDDCQCNCDWNHSGTLTSQDFFDFLGCFFT